MNSSLTFQYPIWFIGFCLLLGLIYAVALYYKDSTFKDASSNQRRILPFLSILRFLSVSAISFLLMAPFLRTRFTDVQKPYIVYLQDNSQSVTKDWTDGDSTAYVQSVNNLVDQLGENYNVQTYTFGNELKEGLDMSFDEKVTDISSSLNKIADRFDNQNVGAIVLASDGIFNQGSNPLYSNLKLDVPIYTVALGDTTPNKDMVLDKVLHNEIAYLGDKTTIRVEALAKNCKGSSSVLTVRKGKADGAKVFTKTINVKDDNFVYSEDVIVAADKAGIQQYSISLTQVEGEESVANNSQSIFIDVLDSRQKILILGASPHPDISAIKQSIESNKNYETKTAYVDGFDGNIGDYNLAILHGVPSKSKKATTVIQKLKDAKVPIWFILSNQSSVRTFNEVQDIVQVANSNSSVNQAKPKMNANFNLFTFDSGMTQIVEGFPPLQAPFGEFAVSPTAQALMKQQIGTVATQYPLFALQQSTGYKMGVLCGEGLWRWRIYDFVSDQNHETVDKIVSKTIQYLVVKNDKRQFRINSPKNLYYENESITFTGELYNDAYELINTPEAYITVMDEDGKEYPFTFSKTTNAYTLDAGFLNVGNYTYFGRTVYNGKEQKASGKFSIAPLQLEGLKTTADHQLLYALTEKFGGEMINPSDVGTLSAKFENKESIKPVLYSSYKNESVINLKWLFFGILSLLSIEWFIRKYNGGY